MDKQPGPILRDIVLVGGGHSHVFVLKRFAMSPVDGVRLTLISPDAHTPYSGMLPGLIAGHYDYDAAHIDLVALCHYAGARFYRDTVTSLDLNHKQVICEGRPSVPYDLLSIDAGSTPDPSKTPGAAGRVIPVKPVSEFLDAWKRLKAEVTAHPDRKICIVGAGAGGVEIALAAQHAIGRELASKGITTRPTFHLVTGGQQILQTHSPKVRAIFERVLSERQIELHTTFFVEHVSQEGLHGNGQDLAFDDILWVTGAEAAPWIAASGLETDDRGFMKIDQQLRSISHADVFGAGDIATIVGHPRPKAGVFAVRQGPPLTENLRSAVKDRALLKHHPQSRFLSLVSTGDKYAVGSWGNWAIEGKWVWTWKDWIDRKFMTAFNDLPEMRKREQRTGDDPIGTTAERATLGDLTMRCGGCGAKVGASILRRALDKMPKARKQGVLVGLDAPDDAAVLTVPEGKALVQTVDQFRAMIDDPFVFGKITANHCLGDIYAMGAAPHSALAIATLPVALPAKTEQTLSDMMAGANSVFEEAGCAIVGGHTGEGRELSFGFAINGWTDASDITRKSGLAIGDALILTKPLGTGILFAAAMRRKAKGRWLDAVIASATQSSREAADILRRHDAHAMTDVTGFGLAGHLHEMSRSREATDPDIEVTLDLDAMPMLEGALEMAEAGIFSSLDPANRTAATVIRNLNRYADDPRLPLLFDPQTAGGLLAAVPQMSAGPCLAALRSAGYAQAAVIGRVLAGSGTPGRFIMLRGMPVRKQP
jgi:selenide, water dikinase